MKTRSVASVFSALLILAAGSHTDASGPKLLINHVGYESRGFKQAVLQADTNHGSPKFAVLDTAGHTVFHGKALPAGKVDRWYTGQYWQAEFSELEKPGAYRVRAELSAGSVTSELFAVGPRLLAESCAPALIAYLRAQRCTGTFDARDRSLPFTGSRRDTVDVHGGWYDASGDVSKYLSHLTYTNYMPPQQTPLVVWAMLEAAERFSRTGGERALLVAERATEEALYGADFLVRMQDPEGYFYVSVFDSWSHDPAQRTICAYEGEEGRKTADYRAAYRDGGGLAIAALAQASRVKERGECPPSRYLAAAERGFEHLERNNRAYVKNGRENIIDDYAALLAATELYIATRKPLYLEAARRRAGELMGRQVRTGPWPGHFQADETGRPYFHAVEAGLPSIALLRYRHTEPDSQRQAAVLRTVQAHADFELRITREVANPFGYARQLVQDLGGQPRTSFFFPHKNESGYWWQGENARLASIAAAALWAAPLLPAEYRPKLRSHATRQLDWILGLNPYDACLLQGFGRNNPPSLPGAPNAFGGVANGITAGFDDEHGIAFLPPPCDTDERHNWRWSEQWIPHAAWLLFGLALTQ